MKLTICHLLLLGVFLASSEIHAQSYKRISAPPFVDSAIRQIKALTPRDSGISIVYGRLENFAWDLRFAYWDSIHESNGGKIIRYPDSPGVKQSLCDSISAPERVIFNKMIELKRRTNDDLLVVLANTNPGEIAAYCFLLLCSDDNPKATRILDHYLYSHAEISVEECGERRKVLFRDFMLGRLLLCMFYDGRVPMLTENELKSYYLKARRKFPLQSAAE